MNWAVALVALVAVAACQRETPKPIEHPPVASMAAATTTGVTACDDYLRRVAACTKLTPAMRETLAAGASVWKYAADQQAGSAASTSCADVAKLADPQLTELGC
jgi:hypothetical protein